MLITPLSRSQRPLGPGFHIYYSSRRQMPEAPRLFIELVRELKPLGL